jgi:hypothetical protein
MLPTAVEFIRANTSIEVITTDDIVRGVWNGCKIKQGQLIVSTSIKPHLGDLLHEAGHLATTPSSIRPLMNGDLFAVSSPGFAEACYKHQTVSCLRHWSNDDASTFWAAMAARAIGLPDSLPFENGYDDRVGATWEQGHEGYDFWQTFLRNEGNRYASQAFYLGIATGKRNEICRWEVENLFT